MGEEGGFVGGIRCQWEEMPDIESFRVRGVDTVGLDLVFCGVGCQTRSQDGRGRPKFILAKPNSSGVSRF